MILELLTTILLIICYGLELLLLLVCGAVLWAGWKEGK